MSERTSISSAAFWAFVNRPENADRSFERVDGAIVEVMPSFPYFSQVAIQIAFLLRLYLRENPIAHVKGEAGGYDVNPDNTLVPDVAVTLKSRQMTMPRDRFSSVPPDIAIEVVSPSDLKNPGQRIRRKLEIYRAQEIPLVWYVYPERQEVEVYRPGAEPETLNLEDVLTGDPILPGLTIAVRELFATD